MVGKFQGRNQTGTKSSHSKWRQDSPQGFTLVEAFVGLLITMISLTIALQMFLTTAYMRARAKQFDDAYAWIQEDFETVRAQAAEFEQGALPYSSHCGTPNNLAATFITDDTVGLGGTSATLGTKTLNGKDYELTRTATPSDIAPERLVALQYELISIENGNPVFEIDAEVVMYAAFRCPS